MSLHGVIVGTLAWNSIGVGLIPTIGATFPIGIISMTEVSDYIYFYCKYLDVTIAGKNSAPAMIKDFI